MANMLVAPRTHQTDVATSRSPPPGLVQNRRLGPDRSEERHAGRQTPESWQASARRAVPRMQKEPGIACLTTKTRQCRLEVRLFSPERTSGRLLNRLDARANSRQARKRGYFGIRPPPNLRLVISCLSPGFSNNRPLTHRTPTLSAQWFCGLCMCTLAYVDWPTPACCESWPLVGPFAFFAGAPLAFNNIRQTLKASNHSGH